MKNIIMKCQADKSWLKRSEPVEVVEDKPVSFLVGMCVAAGIILCLLTSSPAKAACDEIQYPEDYSLSPEMGRYLESQGITTADLEDITREELEDLGVE